MMLFKTVLPRESEIKIEMRKASFGGDRSEAGRYAANVRWQGNTKDDISNQVIVGFESEGKDRGTVWATDKATGKVVGALKFDADFIGRIYVLKDYRRKGIASFLYEEAKKRNGGVEMKADDYTVSGAGFMSAVTGKEVFQTGDNSWAGIEWKSWLERLDRDALEKASFGGNRSEAGRYAANIRWQNRQKKESDEKGRGAKSPLAQSIIEANKSLSKAGITVRVVEMDNSESEAMKKLSEQLRIRIEKSAKRIAKSKNFAPLTQERWFFEAVNLMKASVRVQEDNLMPRKVFIIIAEKGDAIVGAMRFVPDFFVEEAKHKQEGKIPSAGSLRVVEGVGTAMFGEALKLAAKTGTGKIKIEALKTAEDFWKAQGFQRVKGTKLKENSTYDMTIDGETVKALAEEISS